MKTYKELKDFCEQNKVRYEVSEIYSEEWYNPWSGKWMKTLLGFQFGMCNIAGRKGKSEWNWTWFKTIGCPSKLEDLADDTMFYFSHRYSMLNGKYYKGWKEDCQAIDTIERRMR